MIDHNRLILCKVSAVDESTDMGEGHRTLGCLQKCFDQRRTASRKRIVLGFIQDLERAFVTDGKDR